MYDAENQREQACQLACQHSHHLRRVVGYGALASFSVLLSACVTTDGLVRASDIQGEGDGAPVTKLYAAVPKDKLTSAARQLAADGLKAMDRQDYAKASDLFNLAVKTDMTNSYLHFLNAVAYQIRGSKGESSLFPLAEQGYEMAVQFDNSNWLARYYSGLLSMQQRDYGKAQKRLADAALYAGNEPELLYDLAVASYYNRDPKVAAAALEGLRRVQVDKPDDPRVLRASAIVAAALNDGEEVTNYLERLRATAIGADDMKEVEGRVAAWKQAYQREGFIRTQMGGFPTGSMGGGYPSIQPSMGGGGYPSGSGMGNMGGGFPNGAGMNGVGVPGMGSPGMGGVAGGMRSDFVDKQMAVVDVTIISTVEDNTRSLGVNLLDGLKLQFGNPLTQTPAYSRTSTSTKDNIDPTNNTGSTVVTRLIQMPAVTYSLNIANANGQHDEVLARPTLVALANQPSVFFSGQDIVGAAVSGGQGSSVQIQKEVGVKLAVIPEFLPDNMIKLNVAAERTFLAIPSTSVKFDFRLDTNKTMVNANVVMKFGETLILSGLSERDQSKNRDGVPLLQDVPGLQYFFSNAQSRDYYKSVLILLTPRRAQYTNRAETDVAAERAKMSPEELAMAEFEAQYRPWFKPLPNVAEIAQALESGTLYREFRTGDIAPSWNRIDGHGSRLRSAIKSLYY